MNTLSGDILQTAGTTRLENVNLGRDLHPHAVIEGGTCHLLACQSRLSQLRFETAKEGKATAFANGASVVAAMPTGALAPSEFATGWEAGDPAAILDELAKGGGIREVKDAHCGPVEVQGAPSGTHAVKLSGTCPVGKHGYVYFKIADGPITIYPDSVLSYSVFPLNDEGTHVAVDAVLDSGPPLRDLRLVTTSKLSNHPGTPKGDVGAWTRLHVPLGKASGRTIQYLMFAYDHRFAEKGEFACLLDDVSITSELGTLGDWQVEAKVGPQGLVLDGPKCPIRYTLDGSNPTAESALYTGPIALPAGGTGEIRYALQRGDGSMTPLVFSFLSGE
jgi:hypothetical protein